MQITLRQLDLMVFKVAMVRYKGVVLLLLCEYLAFLSVYAFSLETWYIELFNCREARPAKARADNAGAVAA